MNKRLLSSITLEEQRQIMRILNPGIDESMVLDVDFSIFPVKNDDYSDLTGLPQEEIDYLRSRNFYIPAIHGKENVTVEINNINDLYFSAKSANDMIGKSFEEDEGLSFHERANIYASFFFKFIEIMEKNNETADQN